jgi:lambda family phage portal protein
MREVKQKTNFSEKVGSAIDRVIGVVSPRIGYKRAAYRKASRIVATSYRGASRDRVRSHWTPGGGSPDEDLLFELADLRERSRDLNRNDATASGITNTMTTNVVGTGIKPQSRVDRDNLGLDEKKAKEFQRRAERIWEKWVPHADAGERLDFYEIQHLIDRQILENGEAIYIPLRLDEPGRPYSLALDIIEADRLETPSDLRGDKSIRKGVKVGDRGHPLSYYIRKTHPGEVKYRSYDKSDKYIEIPARNALGRKNIHHLYYMQRPGQTRGIPFFAPVLNYFKDMAGYLEAELVTARICACFGMIIKKPGDPAEIAAANSSSTNSDGQRIQEIEPGMVEYLAQGEDVEAFSPNRPGTTFEPFVNRILRLISAALGLPYELVAKDFSQTNYSSARTALLEARRYFKVRQEWLATKLCQPVWEMLLEEAYLRNELQVDGFYKNRLDWVRAKWIPPGWQWVDPVKEAKSSQLAIAAGLSTLADEAAAQGRDWQETLEQRAREASKVKELEETYGVRIIDHKDVKANTDTEKEENEKDGQED